MFLRLAGGKPFLGWLYLMLFGELLMASWATSGMAAGPVVGILTQPTTMVKKSDRSSNSSSSISSPLHHVEYYIAASYVKWLELAGARAIPIPYHADEAMVNDIFSQINGLLFPGGGSPVPESARQLWKKALEANEIHDDFFPVWGTCLGFEYMVILASEEGETIMQDGFDAENVSLPLLLQDGGNSRKSILYDDPVVRSTVQHQNVTMNNHERGIEPSVFESDGGLMNMFHITSTNMDRRGRSFVSTMEPLDLHRHPFYGVQYHPEKNPFEYATYPHTDIPFEAINHSPDAIHVSVSLAQFFGALLAANQQNGKHAYDKPDQYPLVSSYPVKSGLAFEQVYDIPDIHARSKVRGGARGDYSNSAARMSIRD